MNSSKSVFKTENQLRKYQQKAELELKQAIKKQSKEHNCEEEVEKLLEKLEKLDETKIEKLRSSGQSEEIYDKIGQELESARENLREENFTRLLNYLRDVKEILQSSDVDLPGEEDKESQYYVKVAIHNVKRTIKFREKEVELEGETEDLLERMERLEENEIEKLEENLNADNLEEGFEAELDQKFRELLEKTDEVRENIQNRDYKGGLKYVEKLGSILESIKYDLEQIGNLEEKYQKGEELEGGGNSTVYTLKTHSNRLIKFHKSLRNSSRLKKFVDQVPDEVNLAPILEVGLYEGEAAEIIKRAPGEEVNDINDNYKRMAKVPQEHYEKLVEDTRTLVQHGLKPDYSNDNLFYHETEGFTWIDPMPYNIKERIEKGYKHNRVNPFRLVVSEPVNPNEKDLDNMRIIMEKLIEADPSLEEEIRDTFQSYSKGKSNPFN